MTEVVFEHSVLIDGAEVAGIVIAGGTITRGSSNVNDPSPPPGHAYLELITYDAAGDLVLDYPGISWRGGIRSGFVTTYEDVYEGVVSSLEQGKPLEVRTTTPGGFESTYVDDYLGGYLSTRFVGTIGAIDYTPGAVAITGLSASEALTRVEVDESKFPQETETERVARIAEEAGVTITVEGTSTLTLVKGPDQSRWSNAFTVLAKVAADCDAVFYTRRDGSLVYRTHNAPNGDLVAVQPGATLLNSIRMTQEVGTIINRVTVGYGANLTTTVEDADSIARWGVRSVSETTNLVHEADAQAHGQRLLTLFAEPYWYMPSVDVSLSLARSAGGTYPDSIDALLNLDLDDEVTIGPLLPGSPVPDYTARVLGYREVLSPLRWAITYDLNPAGWTRKEPTS